jgi:Mg-chelatase subunit ChlD
MRFIDKNIELLSQVGSHFSDILKQINQGTPGGGTPLAAALEKAKTQVPIDSGSPCRKKFVILITDGEDTFQQLRKEVAIALGAPSSLQSSEKSRSREIPRPDSGQLRGMVRC